MDTNRRLPKAREPSIELLLAAIRADVMSDLSRLSVVQLIPLALLEHERADGDADDLEPALAELQSRAGPEILNAVEELFAAGDESRVGLGARIFRWQGHRAQDEVFLERSRTLLQEVLPRTSTDAARAEVVASLLAQGIPDDASTGLSYADDPSEKVRRAVASWLTNTKTQSNVDEIRAALLKFAHDRDWLVRWNAAYHLGEDFERDTDVARALAELGDDPDPRVQRAARAALPGV